ncbi:MAG: MFS transporter, partial [Leptolyngbyaceae cyanobacterium]
GLIWLTGRVPTHAIIPIAIAFGCIAIAEVVHAPAAMAIVGELAPESARGIYFSLESQTWALGFLIGPAVGGWTLDHGTIWGGNLWLVLMASALVSTGLLIWLKRRDQEHLSVVEPTIEPIIEPAIEAKLETMIETKTLP